MNYTCGAAENILNKKYSGQEENLAREIQPLAF